MIRICLVLGAALAIASAPLAAAPISPNAGAVTGHGILNDHDGNRGEWQVTANLADGDFSGTLAMTLGGKPLSVTLQPGPAYIANGFCVLRGDNGRNRLELRGKCDTTSFGPGTLSGYFDGDRSFNGEFSGTLQWGKAAAAAARTGVVPSAKLMCAYQERVGGVVAGDTANYALHFSSMVSLTLAGGAYRTNTASGRYTVAGDRVRFTSGGYAGAVGELKPDRGGEPAIYFNLEENRRADGTPIVDAWTTGCARQR